MLRKRLQKLNCEGKVQMVKQALELLTSRVELTGDDARVAQVMNEILDTRTFNYQEWDACSHEYRSPLVTTVQFIGSLVLAVNRSSRPAATESAFWAIKEIAEFASRFDIGLYHAIMDVQVGG